MNGTTRTLSYQYDLEGNRSRVTHPDGVYFTYKRDGLNRVCTMGESAAAPACSTTDASAYLVMHYSAEGRRADIKRPGGSITSYTTDNALRLDSFAQDLYGTSNDLTNGFDYNPAGQITSLAQSNTLYNYTEAQNRVGAYGVNGLNQYTSIDGGAITYDANGNLTADGAGMTYTYDMENHLVATSGSMSSALRYDVLGRLARITVAGTTTDFLYDGDALVGEYVGAAMTRRYVHGDQVDEPLVQYNGTLVGTNYRRYLHTDHQGSIIAHSTNTGAIAQTNSYDPYGIPKSTNDGRFGYTGQTWLKELGLNYYKARLYAPKLGRFLQTDPIFYKDDMNLYAYVAGDPINAADPSGLLADDCLPMETGQGQVCPGPALTITREDRWSAAQNGIKAMERKFDAGRPFDSPKEAAEAYCDQGACALFAQTGFENGANIIPTGDKFRLSDFVLGSDGPTASIALIGDTRAVADVHVHGSEGFSGGAIFSKGQLNIYDGDIGMNVRRGRDGFVFRGSDGAGWWFRQSAFRTAIANSPNGYFYFSKFVKRIR